MLAFWVMGFSWVDAHPSIGLNKICPCVPLSADRQVCNERLTKKRTAPCLQKLVKSAESTHCAKATDVDAANVKAPCSHLLGSGQPYIVAEPEGGSIKIKLK